MGGPRVLEDRVYCWTPVNPLRSEQSKDGNLRKICVDPLYMRAKFQSLALTKGIKYYGWINEPPSFALHSYTPAKQEYKDKSKDLFSDW